MDQKIATEIYSELINSEKIVITAHKSPDGDSIGSSLAMYHFLKSIGKAPIICHPDKAATFLHWMPGFNSIQTFDEEQEKVEEYLAEAEVIICLDFNSPSRVGKMEESLKNSPATKLMIDHHLDPELDFFKAGISEPQVCSTCQLVYEFIAAQNLVDKINIDSATAIYTGLVTDTGSFRFSSVSARTHQIAANLLEKGVQQNLIHEALFDQVSLMQIKLTGYALSEKLVVIPEHKVAYLGLDKVELARFNAGKGDTEGLVNRILAIEGVKMAVFLKEDQDIIKLSFRSKGEIPVNELAKKNFEGGGHRNAAGGKFVGKLENAINRLVTELPHFVNRNKSLF